MASAYGVTKQCPTRCPACRELLAPQLPIVAGVHVMEELVCHDPGPGNLGVVMFMVCGCGAELFWRSYFDPDTDRLTSTAKVLL